MWRVHCSKHATVSLLQRQGAGQASHTPSCNVLHGSVNQVLYVVLDRPNRSANCRRVVFGVLRVDCGATVLLQDTATQMPAWLRHCWYTPCKSCCCCMHRQAAACTQCSLKMMKKQQQPAWTLGGPKGRLNQCWQQQGRSTGWRLSSHTWEVCLGGLGRQSAMAMCVCVRLRHHADSVVLLRNWG